MLKKSLIIGALLVLFVATSFGQSWELTVDRTGNSRPVSTTKTVSDYKIIPHGFVVVTFNSASTSCGETAEIGVGYDIDIDNVNWSYSANSVSVDGAYEPGSNPGLGGEEAFDCVNDIDGYLSLSFSASGATAHVQGYSKCWWNNPCD